LLDTTDRLLIDCLVEDARLSLKELAARVGMSPPSVSERLRRLEERGVIRGFTVAIDPEVLGYNFQVMVRVRPLPGKLHIVEKMLREIPELVECDKVTGDDCFIARLFARSMSQLDVILDGVAEHAQTNTAVVKAQTVARRLPPLE
jgi:Lrp/AsnC family leucine-responsive transcriptional regulator